MVRNICCLLDPESRLDFDFDFGFDFGIAGFKISENNLLRRVTEKNLRPIYYNNIFNI